MFEADAVGQADGLLARLDSVLDGFATLDLTGYSDEQVLDLMTGLEARLRRFAVVDHALVAEADNRGLAGQLGCPNTTGLLARLLGVGSGQARLRVRAARELAPRRAITGERLPAQFPATAAALAAGAISPEHARVITSTIHGLPVGVRDEVFDEVEPELAGYARRFGVDQFRLLARHLGSVLDPDGVLKDAKYRERQRGLSFRQRPDGSISGSFEGTAEFAEALLSVLDKTAAPKPQADGAKDPRSPAQRHHDGLLAALTMLLRSDQLGDCNGVSTTILFTMTAEQAATGTGLARSGHGALIPVQHVLANIGDARLFPVILDNADHTEAPTTGTAGTDPPTTGPPEATPPASKLFPKVKPVAAYGTTHRIFTEGQRLAMIARDKGCTFPGCTVGPAWCQANHITEWQYGKRTCIDDGALLYGFHHREFENLGWHCLMIDGIPHYQPPFWLDHQQTPIRNTAHDIAA